MFLTCCCCCFFPPRSKNDNILSQLCSFTRRYVSSAWDKSGKGNLGQSNCFSYANSVLQEIRSWKASSVFILRLHRYEISPKHAHLKLPNRLGEVLTGNCSISVNERLDYSLDPDNRSWSHLSEGGWSRFKTSGGIYGDGGFYSEWLKQTPQAFCPGESPWEFLWLCKHFQTCAACASGWWQNPGILLSLGLLLPELNKTLLQLL